MRDCEAFDEVLAFFVELALILPRFAVGSMAFLIEYHSAMLDAGYPIEVVALMLLFETFCVVLIIAVIHPDSVPVTQEGARRGRRRRRRRRKPASKTVARADDAVTDHVAAESDVVCAVCKVNERKATFVPCGHFVCCWSCAQTCADSKCYVCRKPIDNILATYQA